MFQTPYKVTDVRKTQSGWVMDAYLTKQAVLPVSIPFNYHELYTPGFCFNEKRIQIKNLFELELSRLNKEGHTQ